MYISLSILVVAKMKKGHGTTKKKFLDISHMHVFAVVFLFAKMGKSLKVIEAVGI